MTNWDPTHCPTCGAGQEPGARFCGSCGSPLGDPDPSEQWAGPPHPGEPDAATATHTQPGTSSARRTVPLLIAACLLVVGVPAASSALLSDQQAVDAGDRVVLEPATHVPDGAFVDGLDRAAAEDAELPLDEITELAAILPELDDTRTGTPASLARQEVAGTAPGVYTVARRRPVCDVAALTDRLTGGENDNGDQSTEGEGDGDDDGDGPNPEDRPARAEAWARAAGLDAPDAIAGHLDTLTPVRLRLDTRVTSYTFHNGRSTPSQALLQAGTGVLVDPTGLPRVRCQDGSPLAAPEPLSEDLSQDLAMDVDEIAANPDRAWERLAPENAAVITPGSEDVQRFVTTDVETTDPVERPVSTNGRRDIGDGDFDVTLQWDSPADLDLTVVDPNGATISPESRNPENSRGRLEADANVLCEDNMTGAEHVSWPAGDAPPGKYTITVTGHAVGDDYQADCGGNEAAFTLTVRRFGEDDVVHEKKVADQQTQEFTVDL